MDRRSFCKAAMAVPFVVSYGGCGRDAPSNRLNMASIGTGRMGRSDMKQCLYQGLKVNARVIAVCDVDSKRAAIAKKEVKADIANRIAEKVGAQLKQKASA